MKTLSCLLLAVGCLAVVDAHAYHMGECPLVQPMQGFQMNKFLGLWYVMQKTETASKCIVYNYTRRDNPGEYTISQHSNHPILGLTPLKHQYHYIGELSVPDSAVAARMRVHFPLSVAGSASHVVFATDYDNYAGIFTCQKMAFMNRQSATLLSRHKEMDQEYLNKLRYQLTNFGVDPFELSIVSQSDCPKGNNTLDINVNPGTFSAENLGNVVRKAGEKIGDGVQWVASAGSKVYHKLAGSEDKSSGKPEENTRVTNTRTYETNEVEWIP